MNLWNNLKHLGIFWFCNISGEKATITYQYCSILKVICIDHLETATSLAIFAHSTIAVIFTNSTPNLILNFGSPQSLSSTSVSEHLSLNHVEPAHKSVWMKSCRFAMHKFDKLHGSFLTTPRPEKCTVIATRHPKNKTCINTRRK